MNLQALQGRIAAYKNYLKTPLAEYYTFYWESLKHFQEHWNTESTDLATMYDQSLQNTTTRRQWKDSDFYPKEMMLKFIQTEPEYVRLAFRDLFHDENDLIGRVNRFLFYCDELLTLYKEKHPNSKENHHYHNHEMAMLYLAYRFPEKYSLYSKENFHRFLRLVSAKNISESHDLERFTKVTKTLSNFLRKDEEVLALLGNRWNEKHYQKENVLAVWELMMI